MEAFTAAFAIITKLLEIMGSKGALAICNNASHTSDDKTIHIVHTPNTNDYGVDISAVSNLLDALHNHKHSPQLSVTQNKKGGACAGDNYFLLAVGAAGIGLPEHVLMFLAGIAIVPHYFPIELQGAIGYGTSPALDNLLGCAEACAVPVSTEAHTSVGKPTLIFVFRSINRQCEEACRLLSSLCGGSHNLQVNSDAIIIPTTTDAVDFGFKFTAA